MYELAFPWALILIPLPILLYILFPASKVHVSSSLRVPFFDAIRTHVGINSHLVLKKTLFTVGLIWTLLIFALAQPKWVGPPLPMEREGRNIMLALDLSGSMELEDMALDGEPVTRLTVVKLAAQEFVKARENDRIGLILFGTQAYLQTPLTYDHQNVLTRLQDATVGLAGQTTSIGDALGLAIKRLQKVPRQGKIIILLTDGANNSGILSPLKAASLATMDDIKIYTIGLGSESDPRAMSGPFFNFNASADLDEKTLQEIAKLTGGQYFRATDPESLQAIYAQINTLEPVKQKKTFLRPQKEYYQWPLGFAVVLLMSMLTLICTQMGLKGIKKERSW